MKKIFAVVGLTLLLLTSCSTNDSDVIKTNNKKTLGTSAHDLLSEDKFDTMVVEVVYVEGYEPTATALNNFLNFLKSRINKSAGISIKKRSIPSPGNTTYTNAQIVAIEDENRIFYNDVNQIAVWVFFADAKSSSDTSTSVILGTAYRNTSFVIYENTVRKLSNGFNRPSTTVLETTVIEHEFGHILGLTNGGTHMLTDHEDSEHKRHCNNTSCLMYWEAEAGSNLLGGIPQLDAQCVADLQANGGK
jgi:hypothetical protein